VRFSEPTPEAPEAPEQGPAVPPEGEPAGAPQATEDDGDDDLNTLARTNHRTKGLSELYGMMVEATTLNPTEDFALEADLLSWCMQVSAANDIPLPQSAFEALNGPDAALWRPAIKEEFQAMRDLKVWDQEPVELPPGKCAVDGRLLFRVKKDQQGKVQRYKARFVARGFRQEKGSDYNETFSSVVKWATIRLCLAMAAILDWDIHVVDIKTAFLHAPSRRRCTSSSPRGWMTVQGGCTA